MIDTLTHYLQSHMPGFALWSPTQRRSSIGVRCRRRSRRKRSKRRRLGSRDLEAEAGRERKIAGEYRRGRDDGGGEEKDDEQAAKARKDQLAPTADG
ncbi:hypothetical protein PG994_014012 [Apiospora phragmitis]|uniref:Uncharacterized protein n=1 Tax=Apiospora phragmitis TaxID=2905665 RepID=A0ABR1T331_9PEZI